MWKGVRGKDGKGGFECRKYPLLLCFGERIQEGRKKFFLRAGEKGFFGLSTSPNGAGERERALQLRVSQAYFCTTPHRSTVRIVEKGPLNSLFLPFWVGASLSLSVLSYSTRLFLFSFSFSFFQVVTFQCCCVRVCTYCTNEVAHLCGSREKVL